MAWFCLWMTRSRGVGMGNSPHLNKNLIWVFWKRNFEKFWKVLKEYKKFKKHLGLNWGGRLPHTQVPKSHSWSNVLGDMTLVGEPFKGHNPLPNLMKELAASSNYEERKRNIEEFNKANKWKKKGISMVPIKYDVHKMPPLPFYCHIRQVL